MDKLSKLLSSFSEMDEDTQNFILESQQKLFSDEAIIMAFNTIAREVYTDYLGKESIRTKFIIISSDINSGNKLVQDVFDIDFPESSDDRREIFSQIAEHIHNLGRNPIYALYYSEAWYSSVDPDEEKTFDKKEGLMFSSCSLDGRLLMDVNFFRRNEKNKIIFEDALEKTKEDIFNPFHKTNKNWNGLEDYNLSKFFQKSSILMDGRYLNNVGKQNAI